MCQVQRYQRQKAQQRNKDLTMLVFDEQRGHSEQFLHNLDRDLSFSDGFTNPKGNDEDVNTRFDKIMWAPVFSKSYQVIYIQFADIIAYVINTKLKRYVYNFPCNINIDKYYNDVKNSIVESKYILPMNTRPKPKDDRFKRFI